ncbi:unnamed protein product [Polarella glacialis]|uniref:anthranilate phosphoribosyltransferase n=1 Tax=Polarella glacialis TaxID=89957 RepID=A0A813KSJ5_POLGL|nr:unnamed protein product [Polarella glacialis]
MVILQLIGVLALAALGSLAAEGAASDRLSRLRGTQSAEPVLQTQVLGPLRWDVIGPFPSSSREQGADVLEAFGGILRIPRGGAQTYPSELVPQWSGHEAGRARWMQVSGQEAGGSVEIDYGDLRWDFLEEALGSTVLRSHGWAVGDFSVPVDGAFAATCSGISWFLLDGDRLQGDPYRTSWRGSQPVHLKAGNHTLHVPFAAWGSHASFRCQLAPYADDPEDFPLHVISRPGMGGRPFLFPDVVEGQLASELASVVLENRGQAALWVFRAEVEENVFGIQTEIQPVRLAPGQQLPVRLRLWLLQNRSQQQLECGRQEWGLWLQSLTFLFRARVVKQVNSSSKQISTHIQLDMNCKNFSDPYAFTFLDADDSVQYAAVRSPAGPCPEQGCPVLFATHGASVESHPIRNGAWANSYQRQQGAWLLMPTNRDKYGYDWQGPGFQNGFMALRHLSDRLPGVPTALLHERGVDALRLVLSGHSMGGHGCLEYLTHHGDTVLAAAPAAGWISFGLYAFDRFRTGDGLVDPMLRGIMYSAMAEWDTDLLVGNAVGIPIVVRVGGNDTSVPPWQLRRFARLLEQETGDPEAVVISEVPGEGHWWGKVVDDSELQEFYDRAVAGPLPALPQRFTAVTLNPATSSGRGGIRMDQLRVPYRLARVFVDRGEQNCNVSSCPPWELRTENVRRLSFYELPGRPLPAAGMIVDGVRFPGESLPSWPGHLCAAADTFPPEWRACADDAWRVSERSAANYGPMRQVFESKLVIVYGTQATDASYNRLLRERAVFIANAAYYRGRFAIELLADTDPEAGELLSAGDSHNAILLGGPEVNCFAAAAAATGGRQKWPIWWESAAGNNNNNNNNSNNNNNNANNNNNYTYRVGPHRYTASGLGYLFLAPLRALTEAQAPSSLPRLALIIAGGSERGFELASSLLPLSSGLTLPDYMVVEQSFRWKGAGGVASLYSKWLPAPIPLDPLIGDAPRSAALEAHKYASKAAYLMHRKFAALGFADFGGPIVDIVGTGGDGQDTFNISTAAGLLAAGAGARIVKHGNRAATSKSGAADIIEALGAKLEIMPSDVSAVLDAGSFVFLFARSYHPAMKHVGPIRHELGIRTVFNILGPLTNPARPDAMVCGVYTPVLGRLFVEVFKMLGMSRALVVHGCEGLDELSIEGASKVWELHQSGEITEYEVRPSDFGLDAHPLSEVAGGTPEENAAEMRELLSGRGRTAVRDMIVMNASAALYAAGKVADFKSGCVAARAALADGRAIQTLDAYISASNNPKVRLQHVL